MIKFDHTSTQKWLLLTRCSPVFLRILKWLLISFYRQGNWGGQEVYDPLTSSQPMKDRAGISRHRPSYSFCGTQSRWKCGDPLFKNDWEFQNTTAEQQTKFGAFQSLAPTKLILFQSPSGPVLRIQTSAGFCPFFHSHCPGSSSQQLTPANCISLLAAFSGSQSRPWQPINPSDNSAIRIIFPRKQL